MFTCVQVLRYNNAYPDIDPGTNWAWCRTTMVIGHSVLTATPHHY